MNVSFRFALNEIDFDMRIEYEADDLQFSSRIHYTRDNLDHIEARYKAIDRVHEVSLLSTKSLRIHYIETTDGPLLICRGSPAGFFASQEINTVEFNLHATILFFETETILSWQVDQHLPDWFRKILRTHLDATSPVIVGTATHYLQSLKDDAKAKVKRNAIRRAKIMLGNAEAILSYFGEPL